MRSYNHDPFDGFEPQPQKNSSPVTVTLLLGLLMALAVGGVIIAIGLQQESDTDNPDNPDGAVVAVGDTSSQAAPCDSSIFAATFEEGGTLFLDGTCTYTISQELAEITEHVTIFGNGATLDIQGEHRPFVVLDDGHLSLSEVTVRDGFGDYGGAILIAGGYAIVRNSSFVDNDAAERGGAIHLTDGHLILTNCTFTRNSAPTGGAIAIDDGNASITFSTISGNTATSGTGGGIAILGGDVTLGRSLVSGNQAPTSEDDLSLSVGGRLVSFRHNLVGAATANSLHADDILGEPPRLNDYADGLLIPRADSAAIDAIPVDDCPGNADQRGVERPQGQACDIGAVEVE